MAKGKKGKKAHDDSWEDDIDTQPPVDPIAAATATDSKPLAAEDDDFGGGGLMAAIKKNRDNKKKKGKAVKSLNDEVVEDGDDAVTPPVDAKAPTEVTEIGEDDFGPVRKGGKKGKSAPAATAPTEKTEELEEDEVRDADAEIKVKTKKEKEKEKKEREKQRKKEQVWFYAFYLFGTFAVVNYIIGCEKEAD